MNLIFDLPLNVPNYVRTKQGIIDVGFLDNAEIEVYIELFKRELIKQRDKRLKEAEK